ncbi:replication initiation protein [Paraburkholderia tropica]|uniref:replication initiation protein n=1 Tax=Paraburkholderia tropica TaxID=92647 RepID=UPI002AAF956E|nr:replication initiation protein [Paraburkholderia tropica]
MNIVQCIVTFARPSSTSRTVTKKSETKSEPTQIALFQIPELPEPFRKAVPAVHIAPQAGPISLQQAKMFNALIKNAIEQNKEGERVWFDYAVGDLISDVGLNTKNRDYVKATINSLVGFVVNWDHLSGKPEWNASGLVAGAKLSGSILKYQFSENIREILMNPRIYASIDMRIAREFKRGHSLTLWENVVRYEGVGRTPRLGVDTLRDLLLGMDWKRGSYAQYKTFKSRVLLPALEEINRIADHEVELQEFKVGRTIAEVQFTINVKKKPELLQEDDLDLLSSVTKFDIPLTEARKLLAEHGAQKIQKALSYTEQRINKKSAQPIENVGSYFRKALIGGWQIEDARGTTASKVVATETRQVQAEDQLLAKYQAYRALEAKAYFNELELDEQSSYVARYNEHQVAPALKIPGAAKKPKKTAESAFFNWLAEQVWGKPTDRDLLNFLLKDAAVGGR